MSWVLAISLMILILGALITAHEFGHFIAARICKIRVDEFAIGMGPKIWSKQGKETLFSLRALPIGGFCAMGEDEGETEDPAAFVNHPKHHKIFVLVFGSVMNLVLGFMILLIMSFSMNSRVVPVISDIAIPAPQIETNVTAFEQSFDELRYVLSQYGIYELPDANGLSDFVLTLEDELGRKMDANARALLNRWINHNNTLQRFVELQFDAFGIYELPEPEDVSNLLHPGMSDAQRHFMLNRAGLLSLRDPVLQPGDRIISVNGMHLYSADFMYAFIDTSGEGRVTMVVERAEGGRETIRFERADLYLPWAATGERSTHFAFRLTRENFTFGTRLSHSANKSAEMVQVVIFSLGELFRGNAGMSDIMGPVGMVDQIQQVVTSEDLPSGFRAEFLLMFAALLAVNLAFVNLLPIPALDGGRILFIIIEAIIRREISPKVAGIIHGICFLLLIGLIFLIMGNDILRIINR